MSAFKGFPSVFTGFEVLFGAVKKKIGQGYATLTQVSYDRFAIDTAPKWFTQSSTGTLDATGHTRSTLVITGHSLSEGNIIRFTSGPNAGKEVQVYEVLDANTVLLSTKLLNAPAADNYEALIPISPTADSGGGLAVTVVPLSVVDSLDAGLLVPTGGNIIPRSSLNALQVVASLATRVRKLQCINDIGEPMNLYQDAARTQFLCHLPLTPDESVEVDIPAASAVFIGAAKNTDISNADAFIEINFLG
jgi:hypothetical protein